MFNIMIENWLVLNDNVGYEISDCGRVRTKARLVRYTHALTGNEHFRKTNERLLKLFKTVHGYNFVMLYYDKKAVNKNVHRLVAEHFINNVNSLSVVNHIDGNKLNNHISNLEWCTDAYNHEHATKNELKARGSEIGTSILNEKCVIAINKLLKEGKSHSYLSLLFEVSRPTISLISQGKTWRHLTGQELNIEL